MPLERQPVFVDQKKIFESNKIFVMQDRSMEEELNRMVKLPALVTEQQRVAQRELANRFATQVIPADDLLLPSVNKQGRIIMSTPRCVANNAKRPQCGAKIVKGRYCYNHQRILEGTIVLKSQFPEMGFGLVTAKDCKKNEHVAQYSGDEVALEDETDGGPYALGITRSKAIDAARTNTCYGRWLNDPKGTRRKADARFVINRLNKKARLITTMEVKNGQEFFVSYGPNYWQAFGVYAKVKVAPAAEIHQITAMEEDELELPAAQIVSSFSTDFENAFDKACREDEWYSARIKERELARSDGLGIRIRACRLWLDEQLWVPYKETLETRIIEECHESAIGGHLGINKNLKLIERYFVEAMIQQVDEYVTTWDKCQHHKSSQQKTVGELMPILH